MVVATLVGTSYEVTGISGIAYTEQTGSAIGSLNPSVGDNTINPLYDGLLAIWDAYNGAGTGTGDIGAPAGWQNDRYWSATPSASASFHDTLMLNGGSASGTADLNSHYVVLQVLP